MCWAQKVVSREHAEQQWEQKYREEEEQADGWRKHKPCKVEGEDDWLEE
jgi:hypothetical protein